MNASNIINTATRC